MELTDRLYQTRAVDALWNYFYEHSGNPIIAMPTGTGKSIVIGRFVKRALQTYPGQRILMTTHVKELIEQNYQKLLSIWPSAPAGIYSAGLGRRDIAPVTYCGIGSVWRNPSQFGHVDLMLIDECHLLSPNADTMYGKFIAGLKEKNPRLKVIGLSATPFRLGMGMLTEEGGLFSDVCYDISSKQEFNKLIADGYLVRLVPKRTVQQLDVSGVRMQGGEFMQQDLQMAVDKEAVTYYACKEMLAMAHDRRSWLVFTTGIQHTEHVAEVLSRDFGVTCAPVHSKLPPATRDAYIRRFKHGELQCLVNNNILTTGFDHPHIDFIGVLRPTNSPVLWVQMLGRGTRPADGKTDCLVADFAGNTARLGPINDPVLPKKKGKRSSPGQAPVKVCESCNAYNPASVRFCENCGYEFHTSLKHGATASDLALIADDKAEEPVVEVYPVNTVTYALHSKAGRPPSVRVSYFCGFKMFQEWLCFEHSGYALHKAHDFWRESFPYPEGTLKDQKWLPQTTQEAIAYSSYLRTPKAISVWTNRKQPQVMSHVY